MTDRGHVHQPGEDPLAPHPMTSEQRAATVEAARRPAVPDPPRVRSGPPSKLTDADVVAIRTARVAGATLRTLAIQYGVSRATICKLATGRMRPHVGGPLTSRCGYTRGTW